MTRNSGSVTTVTLELPAVAHSAPEARHAVESAMRESAFAGRADDAALAVSELVTNAVLHGREPITVNIRISDDCVRVEVCDTNPVSPAFSMLDPTAVTGRGLLLVGSVADAWGVDPLPTGKSVWFELTTVPQDGRDLDDVESLLASWADDLVVDPALERVRIVVTDVDVTAMAAAESHTEGMLRELAIAGGSDDQVVPSLTSAAVALDGLRADIRRQLARAKWHGVERTDITITVQREDAEMVRDFMHALDTADKLSRQGKLLTVPTPPLISEQRQTFLRRVLDQLRS